jgi:TPR repeat protein
MYLNGRGVAKDDQEAVRLFKLAADQGNASGQYSLGFMYLNGRGVAKDDQEAVRLYKLAADQGNADAQAALKRLGR